MDELNLLYNVVNLKSKIMSVGVGGGGGGYSYIHDGTIY